MQAAEWQQNESDMKAEWKQHESKSKWKEHERPEMNSKGYYYCG